MGIRLASALALLTACGSAGLPRSSASSFFASPLVTVATASGDLQVAVRSSPQPPTRGMADFQLTVTSASGTPAEGLHLSAQPWMPAMGHGASVVPSVEETAPGVYEVTSVYLDMPGTWELRISIAGKANDTCAPTFQIP